MKKYFSKTIVLILFLAIVLFAVPAFAEESFIVDSGTCGAAAEWTLDSEGTLTISGEDVTYNYQMTYDDKIYGESNQGLVNPEGEKYFRAPWGKYGADIKKIVIEEGIEGIGSYAFKECTAYETVVIPKSMMYMKSGAFYPVSTLKEVHISDLESWMKIDFEDSANPMYAPDSEHDLYLNGKPLKSVVVPESVTKIKDMTFAFCKSLESMVFHDNVTSIGDSAFAYCTALKSAALPEAVSSIGVSAFESCTSLKSINIPEAVTEIEAHTFSQCGALGSVVVPENVTEIGQYAFSGCKSMVTVSVPDTVKSFGINAFHGCSSLKTFDFPAAANRISGYMFADASALTKITMHENITVIGEAAFWGCKSLEDLTLYDNLQDIGDNAFYGCETLEKIVVPKTVLSIGDIFAGDQYKIYFKGNAPESWTKAQRPELTEAYYPCNNKTWTKDKLKSYGVSIGWKPEHTGRAVTDKAVASTYKKTGLTKGSHCSACGDVIVKQEVVPVKKLAKVKSVSALTAGYNSVKITWKKNSNADGYTVYRSAAKNGTYKGIKVLKGVNTLSYVDKGRKTGSVYYYKVRPYVLIDGKRVYGDFSSADPAKPLPATVQGVKATASGTKTVRIKWKKVSGASGYTIYRSTSKDGTYKAIKRIKSGSTLSYTNTKLKSGTDYYYKVRAYRTVNGKRIYGKYSTIDPARTKK